MSTVSKVIKFGKDDKGIILANCGESLKKLLTKKVTIVAGGIQKQLL